MKNQFDEIISNSVLSTISQIKISLKNDSDDYKKSNELLEEIKDKYSIVNSNYRKIAKDLIDKLNLSVANEKTLSCYLSYYIAFLYLKKEIIGITGQKEAFSKIETLVQSLINSEFERKSAGIFNTLYLSKMEKEILDVISKYRTLMDPNFTKMPIYTLIQYISNKLKVSIDGKFTIYLLEKYYSEKFEIIDMPRKGKIITYVVRKNKRIKQKGNIKKESIQQTKSSEVSKNIDDLSPKDDHLYKVIIIDKLRNECLCKHRLDARKLKILVFDYKKQDYNKFIISSSYCTNCNLYYTTKTELRTYNQNDYKMIMDTYLENSEQVKVLNGKVTIQEDYFNGRKKESFLHKMGYNVSDPKLSKSSRFNILKYIIDNFDYYAKAKNHIENLINEKTMISVGPVPGRIYFSSAIEKWEEDLKNIIDYQTNKNTKKLDTAILKHKKIIS